MSDADKKQFDAVFKEMQSRPWPLELSFEPRSNDAGTAKVAVNDDWIGPLDYRYQNGRLTFEYNESGAKGSFDGYVGRKGGNLTLEGSMKMVGEQGGATITVLMACTATKQ
jgi:hypothetical protein